MIYNPFTFTFTLFDTRSELLPNLHVSPVRWNYESLESKWTDFRGNRWRNSNGLLEKGSMEIWFIYIGYWGW
jgi:hypothetical protein